MHRNYCLSQGELVWNTRLVMVSPYGSFAYGAKGVLYSTSQGVYEQDLSHYQQQE